MTCTRVPTLSLDTNILRMYQCYICKLYEACVHHPFRTLLAARGRGEDCSSGKPPVSSFSCSACRRRRRCGPLGESRHGASQAGAGLPKAFLSKLRWQVLSPSPKARRFCHACLKKERSCILEGPPAAHKASRSRNHKLPERKTAESSPQELCFVQGRASMVQVFDQAAVGAQGSGRFIWGFTG